MGRDPWAGSAAAVDRATAPTPWTLRAIYTAIGLSSAAIAPFVPVILQARGLDPATIGLAAALGALASTLVVPAWGHLADSLVGRARAFRIGLLIAACMAAGLLLHIPVVAVVALLASFTVFASLFIGLADALAVVDLPAPERQYGALRAHASLSFTVGVVAVGFLYSWAGYGAAPAVFLIWAGALLLLVRRIPDRSADSKRRPRADGGAVERGRHFGSLGRAFAVQPRLWLLLAVFGLAFTGLQGALTFIGIRIVDLGGRPSDVALSFGVASIAEIPGLVAAGWLGRRMGLRSLFVGSLVLYGVCIASWGNPAVRGGDKRDPLRHGPLQRVVDGGSGADGAAPAADFVAGDGPGPVPVGDPGVRGRGRQRGRRRGLRLVRPDLLLRGRRRRGHRRRIGSMVLPCRPGRRAIDRSGGRSVRAGRTSDRVTWPHGEPAGPSVRRSSRRS